MTEPALLSICMFAVFALVAGGGWMISKRRNTKQGVLMLIADPGSARQCADLGLAGPALTPRLSS